MGRRRQPLEGDRHLTASAAGVAGRVGRAATAVVLLGVVLVLLAVPVADTWRSPVIPLDEGIPLVYADRLLHGEVPGASFDTTFPPGTTSLVAGSYLVFGEALAAERLVGAVAGIVVVVAGALLLVPRGGMAVVAGAAAIALLRVTSHVAALPITVGSALLLAAAAAMVASTRAAGRSRRLLAASSGVLAGLTVATRIDFGLAVAVLAVVVTTHDAGTRRAGAWIAGAVAGLAPLLVQVAVVGPIETFDKLVREPAFVWGPYRRLTFGEAGSDVQLRFAVVVVAVALVATWSVWVVRTCREDERLWRLAAATTALPAVPYCLQRMDVPHTTSALALSCPALLLAAADVAGRQRERWAGLGVAGAAVVVAVALLPTTVDEFVTAAVRIPTDIRDGYPVAGGDGRSLFVLPGAQAPLQTLTDQLLDRARPGERLIVGTEDPRRVWYVDTALYFLFPDLEPGTYHLEFNPGVVNGPDSRLADDMRDADWLLLNREHDASPELEGQPAGAHDAHDLMRREFCEVGAAGTYRLLERC